MNRTNYYIYIVALLLLIGAATTTHAQTIRGKIYGGGEIAQVDGNTKVEVYTGIVGDGEAFDGGVFGGGLGEPTVVTGKVEVLIGKEGADRDADGATINGDVYGGSALGNTNCSAELVATDASTTSVTLNAGTINGSMYGGALGQKAGINDVTSDIAANVYGPVQVTQYGGNVWYTDNTGTNGSGGIYGCNNLNGEPKNTVKVDIYRTNSHDAKETADDYTDDKYAVFAVYGGGNQASYSIGTPVVTVHGCDNSIEYVYGGGNAAHLTHETDGVGDGNTDVKIWGCELIGNVFGGGNGQVQAANVSGNTNVAIYGGKIINVFGGSNTNGMIGGSANVSVLAQGEGESTACGMDITNVYGGGNMAAGKSGTVTIACTGEGTIKNVYGGANMADLTGDITLNITGGQITNVFGGNNTSGRINGAITVNVDWDTEACGTNSLTNVYGGGNLAPYTTPDGKEGPTVNIKNGTVSNNVYGGGLGEAAVVTGNPIVNLIGGTVTNDIFGGGDAAPVVGNPLVNVNYGTVNDVFAGGRGATAVVTGNPLAYVNQSTDSEGTPLTLIVNDVYGGGDEANVIGTGKVQLDYGTVNTIYGGGNAADVVNTDVVINGGEAAMAFAGGHGDKTADPQTEANVSGNAHLTIHGGTVYKAFAGSNSKGTITGSQTVTVEKTVDALAELHVEEVYGGGNQADGKAGDIIVGCTGTETEGIGDVFGGAREADITGDIAFTIKGGTINRVFGGNNVSGNIAGIIQVNIDEDKEKYDCGLKIGYVYGGGQDAAYSPTTPGTYPEVNIKNGTITHDVFGGGLGVTAVVNSNTLVNILGGSIGGDVYGGGALANIDGNTTVNLFGGAVGGAYGGGLGSKIGVNGATEDVAALVTGNTTVTLGKLQDDGSYTASKVTKTGIFGANNINGTPQGHAFVHVLSTTPRDGQATPYNQTGEKTNSYDVPAVYGGGNLSAYEPTGENDFAEVLIENCDNSIEYVYGGGNAAPVPATQVKIYGANAINHAFAGGNGLGLDEYGNKVTDPENPDYNHGADVGYLGYFSSGSATDYGTGKASITVYGGTVHNVYGGSNTLGYIRGGTEVVVDKPKDEDPHDTGCELHVGNVYGGGNEADINSDVTITCDCSEGGQILYAGANDADVNGNITLNIYSGTFGQVFCGNNQGGAVKGKLEVNIDETGCWPILIGELYGGGNNAPYSVYGYEEDSNGKTLRDSEGHVRVKTSGEKLYKDPVVNIISATRIGNVFGGGYGQTAVVYGNPIVNINTIDGIYSDGSPKPTYVLDDNDKRVPNTGNQSTKDALGAGKIGTIGNVYGGGNAGPVVGDTYVNIGYLDNNRHVSGDDKTTSHGVLINIIGNVYGGSKGIEGNDEAGKVTGETNVIIGKEL